MISFLQDLKADTADLHVRIPFFQKIANSIDTIEDILEEPNMEKDSISLFRNAFWILGICQQNIPTELLKT